MPTPDQTSSFHSEAVAKRMNEALRAQEVVAVAFPVEAIVPLPLWRIYMNSIASSVLDA